MLINQILNEKLYLNNFNAIIDKIPFKDLAKIFDIIDEYTGNEVLTSNDILLSYKKAGLPTNKNEIHIQNKYYNKIEQYNIFRNEAINTVKTYKDHTMAGSSFIAKRRTGSKQKGQLINEIPERPEEYIFQPLVDIKKEYRAIIYYMNGKYHCSGIYEKIGSNLSIFKLDDNSNTAKGVKIMALKATKALGYGFGGVDIAIVKNEEVLNLNNRSFPDVVVLEVNTMPSLHNPRILLDFVTDANRNRIRGMIKF